MISTSKYRALATGTTLLGLAMFAALVYQTGVATILESIRACGSIFVLLVLLSGARHLLRTIAWRLCIEPRHRTVPFVELFNIRLGAEAVTDLTFAGPLLGESTKAIAMSRRIPATDTLSSIVIENLVYSLAIGLFILSGVVAFVLGVALPHRTQATVLVVGIGVLLPIVLVQAAISRRILLVSRLVGRLERKGIRIAAIERRRARIREFEEQVVGFYTGKKALFFGVFGLEMLTNVTGVLEAYLILWVTAGRTSLYAGYLVESVNRAVNAIFPFLPLRVGVDEGGAALVFTALGYTIAAGVSLAVIRKIRSIFWIAVGLAYMARYAAADRRQTGADGGEEATHRQR